MRTIPSRILIALCCASGLAAAACASSAPGSQALSSDLAGTRWAVQSIAGAAVQQRAPSLIFAAEDRISGAGGCNSFAGFYEAQNGVIDVRALGRTERACDGPVMRQEDAFFAVLDAASRYQRDANRLVITADDGRSVVLTALA